MLGISTRSDAMRVSPEYAQAVTLMQLDAELRGFAAAVFSIGIPRNHVVKAYRDSNRTSHFPEDKAVWDISPRRVPGKTRRLLEPELVRNHFLDRIQSARAVLERARTYIDRQVVVAYETNDHRPFAGLSIYIWPLEVINGEGRQYRFNAYELAGWVLDEFQMALNSRYNLEPGAIRKIGSMMKLAQETRESPDFRLLEKALEITNRNQPGTYESRLGHPVQVLFSRHEAIARVSDVFLSFDENTFVVKRLGKTMVHSWKAVSAACILDTTDAVRKRFSMLRNRAALRYLIQLWVNYQHRDYVVINGTRYDRILVTKSPLTRGGYSSNGRSCVEIANLMGAPIKQSTGVIIWPEDWVLEEVSLVWEFTRGELSAQDTLLRHYKPDTSAGIPTESDALTQLCNSLDVSLLSID